MGTASFIGWKFSSGAWSAGTGCSWMGTPGPKLQVSSGLPKDFVGYDQLIKDDFFLVLAQLQKLHRVLQLLFLFKQLFV